MRYFRSFSRSSSGRFSARCVFQLSVMRASCVLILRDRVWQDSRWFTKPSASQYFSIIIYCFFSPCQPKTVLSVLRFLAVCRTVLGGRNAHDGFENTVKMIDIIEATGIADVQHTVVCLREHFHGLTDTLFVTTEPAPTTVWSPNTTPGKTVEFIPIQQFLPSTMSLPG